MKKFLLLLNCIASIAKHSSAQNTLTKMWDYRYGGVYYEYLNSFMQTNDHGYLMSGGTHSNNDGDITQPSLGNADCWIVKTDPDGVKLVDKRYGGSDHDLFREAIQLSSNDFLFGGETSSPVSGDVTVASLGLSDFWLVKTDPSFNILWDKRFGGSDYDWMTTLIQTSDGGYLLGGVSNSPVSGDVTEPLRGVSDYWVVKTDSIGNKLWTKRFGGDDYELLLDIKETSNGFYYLGGTTKSDLSFDVSEPSRGSFDYWVVKIDNLGNKIWDKRYGGDDAEAFQTMTLTPDGGCLLGGFTASSISGEVTHPTRGGLTDYWVVKIDSGGVKQWDARYGGPGDEDEVGYIVPTYNGGWLLSCTSYSNLGSDKSENNLGSEQSWIIKTDAQFAIEWDKTILTQGHDEQCFGLQSIDGCYTLGIWSGSGPAGGYRSQPGWDTTGASNIPDFWIVKFCDSTASPVSLFTVADNICPGSCVEITNNSLYGTSFQWDFPGGNPASSTDEVPGNICYNTPGNYSVTLIVSNANGTDTLTLNNYITVYPLPPQQGITQTGDTLFANPGSAAYQWYHNGNLIPGATNYFYVADTSGNYSVVAEDMNGCEVEAVINNVIANTNQLAVGNWQLTIVPNPVTTTIDIRGLENNSADEINIFNVFGENVFSAVHCQLPIANCQLLSGIYYIEIICDKKIYRTKFMKQ